jgi:SAM-dependent methyltransferase
VPKTSVHDQPYALSVYERWERDPDCDPPAPLAVRDATYRGLIRRVLEPHRRDGSSLLSVGAGTGRMEADLADRGWRVLASDTSDAALQICGEKGLATARFCLTRDELSDRFGVIYCDGVLGHVWDPRRKCEDAWRALAALGCPDACYLLSNDLADDDSGPCLSVRGAPDARFYRPPGGWFAAEAVSTGRFKPLTSTVYTYRRRSTPRRREIITMSLVDERVEPQDRVQIENE